jgi:hypothetical protein
MTGSDPTRPFRFAGANVGYWITNRTLPATETMIEWVAERLDLKADHVAGDVAYGTGEMLGWLVDHDIDPHIPLWDQSKIAAPGRFTRADFAHDRGRDLYLCPGGKELKTSGRVHVGNAIKYIAKKSDCTSCPLKPRCTTSSARHLQRDLHQDARDTTQSLRPIVITSFFASSQKVTRRIDVDIATQNDRTPTHRGQPERR